MPYLKEMRQDITLPNGQRVLLCRWQCENCGKEKLTPAPVVMRVLLKVEADINQAEGLHNLDVSSLYYESTHANIIMNLLHNTRFGNAGFLPS